MPSLKWILLGIACIGLIVLGVLVLAAVAASRSPARKQELTPTQQTGNPYRRFYDYRKK